MKLPIVIRREAQAELDVSYEFYERCKRNLGKRFLIEVEMAFDDIGLNPKLFAKVYLDIREATVSDFPFAIYYVEELNCIRVISVFHTSRDPSIWKSR